ERLNWTLALGAAGAMAIAVASCGAETDAVSTSESALLGDALPGTDATAFAAAKANFNLTETQVDGLGPIFNERSCGEGHSVGALGGAGQNVERRYGTLTNGVFNSLGATGGSLRQLFGIGGFNPSPGVNCQSGT